MTFRPPYIRVTRRTTTVGADDGYAAFIVVYPPEDEAAIGTSFQGRGPSPLQATARAVAQWAAHEQAVAVAKLNEAVAKFDAVNSKGLADMVDINIANGS